jgi:hypothetical protein
MVLSCFPFEVLLSAASKITSSQKYVEEYYNKILKTISEITG